MRSAVPCYVQGEPRRKNCEQPATPRRNVLTLTGDAGTAIGQLRRVRQPFDTFVPKPRILTFASRSLFVTVGLSIEIDTIDQELRNDLGPAFQFTIVANG